MFGFLSASTTVLTDDDATNFVQDLRAVDELNKTRSIDGKTPLALHIFLDTDGGKLGTAEVITKALCRYKGKISVFVETCSMSAGTLIALCAQDIHLLQYAYLGKIDPQIGSGFMRMSSFGITGCAKKSFKTNWISDLFELMEGPADSATNRMIDLLGDVGDTKGWSVQFAQNIVQHLLKGVNGADGAYDHDKPYDYTDLMKFWVSDEADEDGDSDGEVCHNPKLFDGWPESAKALRGINIKPVPIAEHKNAMSNMLSSMSGL